MTEGSTIEKIVADSRKSGQVAKTPRTRKTPKTPKISSAVDDIDGLTVRPDKLISSVSEMTHIAQNVIPVPTPRPGAASKETPGEAIDQSKENDKGKDKNNGSLGPYARRSLFHF